VIQYSTSIRIEPKSCGVPDTPLEPVIGLAKGETRWRGMTTVFVMVGCTLAARCPARHTRFKRI
jgi:hypothetical protein